MFFLKLNKEIASVENVVSCMNNFLLLGSAFPKIEIKKITNPKPPNHCDSECHKRRLQGIDSIEANAEAPVVVKPEIDSKIQVGMSHFKIKKYGSAPNNVVNTHKSPVVSKISLREMEAFCVLAL